uniref:Transposase (Putative), gypsy type n=1 Tax=Tanacetum cinerariifolium TaxID=118510 RepID=A0A6L2P5H8_TANCI|nr:hypothetical protein [Tanacetum cinerariifolium]
MNMFAFIQVADHTKVKVKERERAAREARLLDSTVGRVVSLLPVTPARAKSEFEASVKRLFDECGSADQVDSAAGGGQEAEVGIATGGQDRCWENMAAERPKRPRKKSRTDLAYGYFFSVCHPEHESGSPIDSITGLNIRTIGASEWFIISLDSSHHPSTHASEAECDSIIRPDVVPPVMTEVVVTSLAVDIPSVLETGVKRPCTKFFVPQWNVLNDSLLDDYDVSREFVDHLAPPALFSHIREMDYHHLFTEFNREEEVKSECEKQADLLKVSASEATKKKHASEIDALKQKNVALENEKGSLDRKVAELQSLVSTKDLELKELNVVVSSPRSQKDGLVDQVHELEATGSGLCGQVSSYERLKGHIKEFQDAQMNIVNDKVAKLDTDRLEMALHFEEKSIFQPWEQPLAVPSRKGMHGGLSAGIDHGKAGMSLEDVVAYNPSVEADYTSAFQRLREVNFPLLFELQYHKDESTADVMDLLHLEGPLADVLGMSDLQPNIEQRKLPIHRPEDQVILGETSLLVALDVTHSCVERIMENIAAQWSAFISVWTPLVDPLSVENLVGTAGTSNSMPVTVATTTALSITFASASTVPPITIEDYETIGTDGPEDAKGSGQGEAASFPNTVEFEKEELDTTPERDPQLILYWSLLIFLPLLIGRGPVWPFCSGFCT